MGVTFDPINKYILITSPTILISALEIYNSAMDWCDDPITIGYTIPMRADGKFDMGGGAYSDSIFRLINGWKIKPYDGDYDLVITGTLLGEPGESRWVSPDSGNVSIEFQVSSQATVIEPEPPDLSGLAEEVWAKEGRGQVLDGLDGKINGVPEATWALEERGEILNRIESYMNDLHETMIKLLETTPVEPVKSIAQHLDSQRTRH